MFAKQRRATDRVGQSLTPPLHAKLLDMRPWDTGKTLQSKMECFATFKIRAEITRE